MRCKIEIEFEDELRVNRPSDAENEDFVDGLNDVINDIMSDAQKNSGKIGKFGWKVWRQR